MLKWIIGCLLCTTVLFYLLGYNVFSSTLVEDTVLHDLSRVINKEQLL